MGVSGPGGPPPGKKLSPAEAAAKARRSARLEGGAEVGSTAPQERSKRWNNRYELTRNKPVTSAVAARGGAPAQDELLKLRRRDETHRRLTKLARAIAGDSKLKLEAGEDWGFNFETRAITYPVDAFEKLDAKQCLGLIYQQLAFCMYSRMPPANALNNPAFAYLWSNMETLRINKMICQQFAGVNSLMGEVYAKDVDLMMRKMAVKQQAKVQQFARAFGYMWVSGKDRDPAVRDKDVKAAIEAARAVVDEATRLPEGVDLASQAIDEPTVRAQAVRSYEIIRDELWPIFETLLEKDLKDRAEQPPPDGQSQGKQDGPKMKMPGLPGAGPGQGQDGSGETGDDGAKRSPGGGSKAGKQGDASGTEAGAGAGGDQGGSKTSKPPPGGKRRRPGAGPKSQAEQGASDGDKTGGDGAKAGANDSGSKMRPGGGKSDDAQKRGGAKTGKAPDPKADDAGEPNGGGKADGADGEGPKKRAGGAKGAGVKPDPKTDGAKADGAKLDSKTDDAGGPSGDGKADGADGGGPKKRAGGAKGAGAKPDPKTDDAADAGKKTQPGGPNAGDATADSRLGPNADDAVVKQGAPGAKSDVGAKGKGQAQAEGASAAPKQTGNEADPSDSKQSGSGAAEGSPGSDAGDTSAAPKSQLESKRDASQIDTAAPKSRRGSKHEASQLDSAAANAKDADATTPSENQALDSGPKRAGEPSASAGDPAASSPMDAGAKSNATGSPSDAATPHSAAAAGPPELIDPKDLPENPLRSESTPESQRAAAEAIAKLLEAATAAEGQQVDTQQAYKPQDAAIAKGATDTSAKQTHEDRAIDADDLIAAAEAQLSGDVRRELAHRSPYQSIRATRKKDIDDLVESLQNIFMRNAIPRWGDDHYKSGGKYDNRKAMQSRLRKKATGKRDPKVYKHREDPTQRKQAIILAVDISESMDDKIWAVKEAVVIFQEALAELEIPFGVVLFNKDINVVKDLRTPTDDMDREAVLPLLKPQFGTWDWGATKTAKQMLLDFEADQKLIVFLSDGAGTEGQDDAVKRLEYDHDIKSVGVGIAPQGCEAVKTTYQHHLLVPDVQQLVSKFCDLLVEELLDD